MDPKQLARVPLFQRLPEEDLKKLASKMEEITQTAGELLFCEGDRGDYFFVISEGKLEVIKAMGTSEERLIAVRIGGEFIGELSLINPLGTRMASVRARTDAQLWQLSRHDFEKILEQNSSISNLILRELSQRLTTAHEKTIVDLQRKNQELSTAYQDLKDAHDQIIEKERLERELQLAHQIQKSILPESIPETDRFDFGVFLEPARAVGGDFYDLFPLGEDKIGVLIGDVTDKGVPSSLVSAQTHALIYSAAISLADPVKVFHQVNTQMLRLNQSGLFVTAIYGILDLNTKKFQFARAGHEIPILLSDTGKVRMAPKGVGQPLGIFDEPLFDLQEITITGGERLLLYTDGVLDMYSEDQTQFGMKSMQEALGETCSESAQTGCEKIYQRLYSFQGDTDQDDDITMVMIHSLG